MRELYEQFMDPVVTAEKEDWDNLSDDAVFRRPENDDGYGKAPEDWSIQERAHLSFENCLEACALYSRCFQHLYRDDGACGLSYSYRLGRKRDPEVGVSFKSGWDLPRIAKVRALAPCHSPHWVVPTVA